MKTERILLSPVTAEADEQASWSFKETAARYLYHWPLFLVCIILSLAAAFFYLKYTKPAFSLKAKLLIKDEKNTPDSQAALREMMMPYQGGKNVENEIEIIESRELMRAVVDKLQLWATYEEKGDIVNEDLYSTAPVRFDMIKPTGMLAEKRTFEIEILSPEKFAIHGEKGSSQEFLFSNTLKNNFGTWRLEKTPDFNKYIGKTLEITIEDPEVTTGRYLKEVSATQMNKKASIVELSMKDKDVERGKDILNNLITQYNLASQQDKQKTAESELQFIDERLASLRDELTAVEKNVEGFRSSRGLTDISSESKLYLEGVKTNDANLNEVNVKLNIIRGIETYLANNDMNAPSTIGIQDPGLTVLINKLNELQSQKERLLATTPESNPVFDPLNNQISSTKAAIKDNIRSIKNSLISTKNQLESYNDKFMANIKELPSDERQLLSIKRQQSIKENLYVYLLQKREEAALGNTSNMAFSKTVDSAYIDGTEQPLAYTFALLAGLIIPAGLVFGRNYLNNRVSSSRDIEEYTSVPISAELFYEESESPIVIQPKSGYLVGEQFRSLRTDLQYLHNKKDKGRVTLITSSIASEGKSFVTSNLGVTLAASGRKTIILELDMRKPKISQNFEMHPVKGLSDFLQGKALKDEIIQHSTEHPGLSVIGTGPLPDNPSELLEQPELDELIAWLRTEYDDILIDTPPIYLVTDALILSRLTDAALYLVRQNHTYKVHLEFIEQLRKEKKMPSMKIIFNGVQMKGERRYGYGYYVDTQKTSFRSVMRDMSRRLAISN